MMKREKKRFFLIQAAIFLALLSFPSVLFAAAPAGNSSGTAGQYQSLQSLFSLYQPYLANLSAYEPMYFLVGTNPAKSRFQVSFKYQLAGAHTAPQKLKQSAKSWDGGLYFGYTQTSFWDLKAPSKPFTDTSYKPELFFLSSNLYTGSHSLKGLFLQTGLQHESNGRGGDTSRSTNFFYVKPIMIFYNKHNNYGISVAPKLWIYVDNDDSTNPGLPNYWGYFDLEVKCGQADGFVLETNWRQASKGSSVRMDLTYPLRRSPDSGTPDVYLDVQYVNVLGESMLEYNQRNEALRVGIAIVR